MKVFGFNAFLVLIVAVFGLIGGGFIMSSQFTIEWKILMAFTMFLFAFGCSSVQLYLDALDLEEFRKRVS